tara:strand:- start:54 stop:167 length:114 start_codon:yes stop_codon:yes gene_type:complete
MRECVNRKCNNLAFKGFRKCMLCIQQVKEKEVKGEEE